MKQCKMADNDTSLPHMLNAFNVRCEQNATGMVTPAPTTQNTPVPFVTASEVGSVFLGINPRKATGPDGVPSRALRSCADQLAKVFTDIFNLPLLQAEVPNYFKKTTVIPIPKKAHTMCLNDYCPIALTSIVMKCFERLITAHINSSLPACLDPLQFAYQ
eukprot:g25865.t1